MARPRIARQGRLYYIYLIECAGLVKIGISNEPSARLSMLQVGSPFPLRLAAVTPVPGYAVYEIETAVHQRLAKSRIRGEWFDIAEDLALDAIHTEMRRAGVKVVSLDHIAQVFTAEYAKTQQGVSVVRDAVTALRMQQATEIVAAKRA